ncbi:hypothetical protein OG21DRAFT_1522144 [Imleria badia]|nr:hypothetical protein OG21DRAFT_1522144 [Imleria badia]
MHLDDFFEVGKTARISRLVPRTNRGTSLYGPKGDFMVHNYGASEGLGPGFRDQSESQGVIDGPDNALDDPGGTTPRVYEIASSQRTLEYGTYTEGPDRRGKGGDVPQTVVVHPGVHRVSSRSAKSSNTSSGPSDCNDTTVGSSGDAGARMESAGTTNVPGSVQGEIENPCGGTRSHDDHDDHWQAASPSTSHEVTQTRRTDREAVRRKPDKAAQRSNEPKNVELEGQRKKVTSCGDTRTSDDADASGVSGHARDARTTPKKLRNALERARLEPLQLQAFPNKKNTSSRDTGPAGKEGDQDESSGVESDRNRQNDGEVVEMDGERTAQGQREPRLETSWYEAATTSHRSVWPGQRNILDLFHIA